MYDDLNVRAIYESMNKSNRNRKEKITMLKFENKFSYWLRWYLGIQTNLTDINNDWK